MIKARACAGDIAAGEKLLARALALHLAQISRLRRGRRHPRDEAADPRLSRSRRDRGRGPQHQARPRRHPRDRVLRADPAAHRRRPAPRAARPRDARHARSARGRRLDRAARRATSLAAAYRFLRTVEHRLQMVADEQTHTLPGDRDGLERFARFLGFADRDAFAEALLAHLRNVQRHYARPVRDGARCRGRAPRAELSRRCRRPRDARQACRDGLSQPLEVSALVRRLAGRRLPLAARRACARAACRAGAAADRRNSRVREIRTQPLLAFDRFLAGLHGGGAACSRLLRQNPDLVALIALVLGTAPRLADILAQLPASHGCGDRSELLRRAARGGGAGRGARPLARAGRRLRGLSRPHPHVRARSTCS